MKYCYYIFDGYSSVAAASDLLRKYHIRNSIVKAPAGIRNCCSFAVMIYAEDSARCRMIFAENNRYPITQKCV